MKKTILYIVLAMLWPVRNGFSQDIPAAPKPIIPLSGKVTDEKGMGLPGASVKVKNSKLAAITDVEGRFRLTQVPKDAVLLVSFIGYLPQEITADDNGREYNIILHPDSRQLEEVVVSTGYQEIPLERATGSFVHINNDLLNRRVGTHILDRLEGISSGLVFNRNTLTPNEETGISIRGRSTIDNNVNPEPLIIVDSFPFEGDINNINPNDVESITILKDAAAASIWGARAGNGVIVITTKKGRVNEPLTVKLNSNLTVGQSPDLFYSSDFVPSAGFIAAERFLFDQGFFNVDLNNTVNYTMISPAVEIFQQERLGILSAAEAGAQLDLLRKNDVRHDFQNHVYRNSVNQQYALNLSGGAKNIAYKFSAGLDDNQDNLVRNGNKRYSLNSYQTFTPIEKLELSAGLSYFETHVQNNTTIARYGNVINGGRYSLFPYARLASDNGEPLAIFKDYRTSYVENAAANGFLDWQYRPLEEIRLADAGTRSTDMVFRAGAKYRFTHALSAELQYQYENERSDGRNYRSNETYYTRNLINQFAQKNPQTGMFTYPFPNDGILDLNNAATQAYNLRGQLNFNRNWLNSLSLNAIAGAEARQIGTESYTRTSYGYNDELGVAVNNLDYAGTLPRNPAGTARISPPAAAVGGLMNRYISYYGNAALSYLNRYTLSFSGRKDGANIFGVKTNDKITPLWSAGLAWNTLQEPFFNINWLTLLKLRATYGYSGNVYNASAYLTAQYATSSLTGTRYATVSSPPNPELRWERVRVINTAADFAAPKDVITGSIELYQKDGLDLIESAMLAPSTGFRNFKGNAASTRTRGIDLTLGSLIINRAVRWRSKLLFSYLKDRVIHFDTDYLPAFLTGINVASNTPEDAGLLPVEGRSMFGLYSYKWAGIDPVNGDPVGYLNSVKSKDYLAIMQGTSPENLIYHGSSRPTVFGGFRNDISYKNISISANITYKLNYYFRRRSASLNYQEVLTNNGMHADFNAAWKKPGDELTTNVPSITYPANNNRNFFYRSSEILVEKGDHVRLQDVNLSYNLDRNVWKNLPAKKISLYLYANNLGLLWKANKARLDPDYLNRYAYPNPRTLSFGINATF